MMETINATNTRILCYLLSIKKISLEKMVDPSGFEPEASCLQSRRSSRLIYGPVIKESKKGDDKDNGQLPFSSLNVPKSSIL